MVETIATFKASDGYECSYRSFEPATEPKGVVIFVHGIQSHGGWYLGTCEWLRENGYAVYFPDRRGAGLNTHQRGDTPSFRRLLDDLGEFIRTGPPSRWSSELARSLVAISWGGKLGVGLPYRHPGLVNGLALLCPGFFPQVGLPFWTRISIGRARVRWPSKLYPIPLNDPELFTAQPEWLQFLREDELALHEATARFMIASLGLDVYLRRAWKQVNVPTLLMLAGQDRIIINEKTRRYVEKFPTDDRTMIEYPEAYHTLEFEPDPDVYRRDLLKWLNEHVVRV